MKKLLLLLAFTLLPTISFAETITTTANNVPVQISNTSPQVIMLLPKSTQVELLSSSGNWYNIKYNNTTGWIYKLYVSGSLTGDTDNVPNIGTDEKMSRIVDAANTYGSQYGIDPYLILALIFTESGFDPYAVSSADCRGLMQVSATYAPSLGFDVSRLFEIEYNIQCGTKILSSKITEMGNIYDALRAYNYGSTGAKENSANGSNYANKVLNTYESYKQNGFSY